MEKMVALFAMGKKWYFWYTKGNMGRSIFSKATLALLLMQIVTPTVFAVEGCSVSAPDTIAGLGTEVTIVGCEKASSSLLIVQSPDNQNFTQTILLDGSGNAVVPLPSESTTLSGRYAITVAGQTSSFSVLPDRADDAQSSIILSPQAIDADGRDTATVTAILRDRYDNPVDGRPLALIASRLSDDVSAQSKQTDNTGRFLWTIRSTEAGVTGLTVYDIAGGRQMKLKASLTVGRTKSFLGASLTGLGQGGDAAADLASEVIDRFELSLPQNATDIKANELFGLEVRAMRGPDIARGYIGTLIVKSSDPDAVLPKQGQDPRSPKNGSIEMRSVDQGERKVPLAFMLRNGSTQTIEVSDSNDPTFVGKITLNVLQPGGPVGDNSITILDPKDRSFVRGGPILLQGRAPSLINLKVKGGSEITNGESDQEGVFRISVPINPADKEVTLFVVSENGAYESNPVHILIDNTPPVISSITLDPPEAKAAEETTITVKSEAGLNAVIASVQEQTITLKEGSGGLYTGLLTAPVQSGYYDITVTAKDQAENSTAMLTKWKVGPTLLPVVQNVTAEGLPGAVSVRWDAIDGFEVAEYKIYVSLQDDPENILYSIGTKKPTTAAIIRDLPLGRTYLFSLTMVTTEEVESPEKSDPASAAPLGIALRATPGKDSLFLEWTPMPNLPLDHYILEYGTEPGTYTERRSINGLSESTVLRDLIGGVTYEVKLTPVAVTGKELSELSAITHGTPTSDGFIAGTAESVPTDMLGHPGAPLREPSLDHVPENAGSGIPSMAAGILFIGAIVLCFYWRKASDERRQVDAFLQTVSERYHS